MRRMLLVLLLIAVLAPVTFAAEPPATPPAAPAAALAATPAAPAADEPAAPAEPAAGEPPAVETPAAEASVDLADLFADLDATNGAESRYLCPSGCTTDRDCLLNEDPAYCPPNSKRACNNPSGYACAGTCFCCT